MEDRISEIDLLELLIVLKKKWWMIIIAGILGCSAAVVFSIYCIEPTYQSSLQLYVFSKETTDSPLSESELQAGSQLVNDYKIMMQSRPVLEDVIKNLKMETDYKQLGKKLKIENPDNSRVIVLIVTDQDPEKAMLIVNQIAASSSKFIVEVMKMTAPKIIESGVAANEKLGPNVKKNGFLGAFLAVILISSILIAMELLKDSVKDEDDVENYLGLTVLARVPKKRRKVRKYIGK